MKMKPRGRIGFANVEELVSGTCSPKLSFLTLIQGFFERHVLISMISFAKTLLLSLTTPVNTICLL